MPGPLYDCYVLAPERSADLAERFLDHFLPDREALFDPGDPSEVLGIGRDWPVRDVLRFLDANPEHAYRMYWRNRKAARPFNAIVAFEADGSLILGLSPSYDNEPDVAHSVMVEMKEFAGAEFA